MADVKLAADKRSERGTRPAKRLRRVGLVPAVVYGLEDETVAVTVSARELGHILGGEAGVNTLINLQVDGSEQLTLARQIQRDPIRGDLVHVDFVRIRRDVAVEAEVPVQIVGEAPGTKEGGIVEQQLFSLRISAKPADIPSVIEVDVSGLDLNDQIRFEDLRLPAGVETEYEPDELVVQVIVPRVVEEPVEEEEELAEGEELPEAEAAEAAGGEAPAREAEGGGGETADED